jgi:uncharacterized protein (TIGR03382 family)
VERSIGLAFTTLTIFAPLAHAAHPKQAVKPEGTASPFEFVATAIATTGDPPRGYALVRQVLPAAADTDQDPAGSGMLGGCTAAGGLPSGATALALLGVLRRRRR